MKYTIFLILLVLMFAFVPLEFLAKLANPWIMFLILAIVIVGIYITYTIREGDRKAPLEE